MLFLKIKPLATLGCRLARREDYEGKGREKSKRSETKIPPRIRLVDVGDVIKK